MADEIERQLDVKARLLKGERGVFDVRLDGELIFSKHAEARFPDSGETERLLAARLSA